MGDHLCPRSCAGRSGHVLKRAAQLTDEKAADRAGIASDLERYDKEIEIAKGQLEVLNQRKDPYVRAAFERGYWLGIFKDLNERMETDRLWITVLEPLSKGESVIESPDGSGGVPLVAPVVPAGQESEGKQVDAIRISGLFRENQANPTQSSEVVIAFFNKLKESPNFAIGDLEQKDVIKQMDPSTGGSSAGAWMMEVPLPDDATLRIRYDQ